MLNERDKQVIRGALRILRNLTEQEEGLCADDGDTFAEGEGVVRLPELDEIELLLQAAELQPR